MYFVDGRWEKEKANLFVIIVRKGKQMNRLMIDHLGRYAQQGHYLAENKKRIEREGRRCDNCSNYGMVCELTGADRKPDDVCKDWMNNSLPSLSKLCID